MFTKVKLTNQLTESFMILNRSGFLNELRKNMGLSKIVFKTFEIEDKFYAELFVFYFVLNSFQQFVDCDIILQRLMIDSLTEQLEYIAAFTDSFRRSDFSVFRL